MARTILHKEMTTADGHKAEIRIEKTPRLMVKEVYHIKIFEKQEGFLGGISLRKKKVIHEQTCHAGPQLPELIVRGWTKPSQPNA